MNYFPFVFYTTPKNPFHIKGELYEVDKKVLKVIKNVINSGIFVHGKFTVYTIGKKNERFMILNQC